MGKTSPLKLLLALLAAVLLGGILLLGLTLGDTALSLWSRIHDASPALAWLFVGGVALFLLVGVFLIRRILRGPAPSRPTNIDAAATEEEVTRRIERNREVGAEAETALAELRDLAQRREAGEIHVAFFAPINAGKSSLIKALIPEAAVEILPVGGATREISRHVWTSPAGDRLFLTDLPGILEAGGNNAPEAREEAARAHIVIYVADGDLTRQAYDELQALRALGKPMILALNKSDHFTPTEITAIKGRLKEHLGAEAAIPVVSVSAGGAVEVPRILPDGREEIALREAPARVEALKIVLQRLIDDDPAALEKLRDAAVFKLAAVKLDAALAEARRDKAEALTAGYAKKAAMAGFAAITPGMDVVIQGALGIGMVKELCALYEVSPGKIDLDRLLLSVDFKVKKITPLILAAAGNVLKAFPGIGTVAGGALHAVVYGLIFQSLGRAIAQTLEDRGSLTSAPMLQRFEADLGENLESRALDLAKEALAWKKREGTAE